jgi:hypothetical protein
LLENLRVAEKKEQEYGIAVYHYFEPGEIWEHGWDHGHCGGKRNLADGKPGRFRSETA